MQHIHAEQIEQKLQLGHRRLCRELLQVSLEQRRQWMMQVAQSMKDNADEHAALDHAGNGEKR